MYAPLLTIYDFLNSPRLTSSRDILYPLDILNPL